MAQGEIQEIAATTFQFEITLGFALRYLDTFHDNSSVIRIDCCVVYAKVKIYSIII